MKTFVAYVRPIREILVIAALLGQAACMTPAPPRTAPITQGQTEYVAKNFAWEPGVKLAYKVRTYDQSGLCCGTTTDVPMEVYASERTSENLVRVRIILNGTEFGSDFFDTEGRYKDSVVTDQKWSMLQKGFLGRFNRPFWRSWELWTGRLRIGDPVELTAASEDLFVPPFSKSFTRSIPITAQFLGYGQLGDRVVAMVETKGKVVGTAAGFSTLGQAWGPC